jgi:hypothetical protein
MRVYERSMSHQIVRQWSPLRTHAQRTDVLLFEQRDHFGLVRLEQALLGNLAQHA